MKIKIQFIGTALTLILLSASNLMAQDTTKVGVTPAPLVISGQVDAYYRASSNKVNISKTSYTSQQGAATLGMANVAISKDNGKIGFMADVMFGPRADETNYAYSSSPAFIKQLYMTYKPTNNLKFTAGNFMTFVGYELVEASNNLNYSMSYNYTNGPFFHTGLKMDVAFTDKFAGMFGIFNQTDSKGYYGLKNGFEYLNTSKKVGGAQLSYVNGMFKIYLNALTGKSLDSTQSFTFDVTTIYQMTDKFAAGFNFITQNLSKKSNKTAWNGSALYLNYAFSPKFILAARGELFNDKDGVKYSAADNVITAFTLSGNIKIDAFTIIPEIRFDSVKKSIWQDENNKAKDGETSFILAAVYKF